ncbi:MAG: YnbE family lipoprotein [Rhodospirillaceae bacterium]|nr:YnbE family lipoprotein [Rhodospirillaceae bacterium]
MKGRNVPRPAQIRTVLGGIAVLGLLAACNPTVKVEAPDKPIVINLNVKIEQEVRVKIDKDVENLVQSNPNLF